MVLRIWSIPKDPKSAYSKPFPELVQHTYNLLRRSTWFRCSFTQKSELAQALGVLIFWCFGLGSSARKHLPPPIVVVTVVSVHMFDWLHTEWPGLITCVSHIVLALCCHFVYLYWFGFSIPIKMLAWWQRVYFHTSSSWRMTFRMPSVH